MGLHRVRKGLDLPIQGQPKQEIDEAQAPGRVAVLAEDYVGMKPTMFVSVGDSVRRGQVLFEDKKAPGVRFTSPAGRHSDRNQPWRPKGLAVGRAPAGRY